MTGTRSIKLKTKIPGDDFLRKNFRNVEELPKQWTGAFLERINASPDVVFDFLEFFYGPYEDLLGKFVFIDDKSSWTRFLGSNHGILRIYDYKGLTSIGYTGAPTPKLKLEARSLRAAIEKALPFFKKLKREALLSQIKHNPILNFMRTFGAVLILLDKAKATRSRLEALVLYSSLIDALLRIGIVLRRQLRSENDKIDADLIYQQKKNSYLSERDIQRLALREKIISKRAFAKINSLYDRRNRAIHRYFISNFEYAELDPMLADYEKVYRYLNGMVGRLEKEQVRKGVGMTKKEHLEYNEAVGKRITEDAILRINSQQPMITIPKRNQMDWSKIEPKDSDRVN